MAADPMGLGVLVAALGAIAWRIASVRIADPDPERGGPAAQKIRYAGFCAFVVGVCVAVAGGLAQCGR